MKIRVSYYCSTVEKLVKVSSRGKRKIRYSSRTCETPAALEKIDVSFAFVSCDVMLRLLPSTELTTWVRLVTRNYFTA